MMPGLGQEAGWIAEINWSNTLIIIICLHNMRCLDWCNAFFLSPLSNLLAAEEHFRSSSFSYVFSFPVFLPAFSVSYLMTWSYGLVNWLHCAIYNAPAGCS